MTNVQREEVAALLERAAERVERGWCQGAYARALDAKGSSVWADSPEACRWCAEGAICGEKAAGRCEYPALRAVYETLDGASLSLWNDAPGRTQAEVVALLRETARRVREGE